MFLSAKEIYSPVLKSERKKKNLWFYSLLLIKSVPVASCIQSSWHRFPTKGQTEVHAELGSLGKQLDLVRAVVPASLPIPLAS